ncbi:zinc-binding dehydrogenase-domain-containing protein [Fennellomyces sp. T-0311]|nr:zinc-binding dehydrogenase-domain-containing protein [Fennellomyces sp. T-0311]
MEAKFRSGTASPVSLSYPRIFGGDYTGVVVDKGSEVSEFEIGDEAFGVTYQKMDSGRYCDWRFRSVGIYAAQLAKAPPNIEVIGICSGKNAGLVTSLGVDRVVDYTVAGAIDAFVKEDAETFDLIVDCVGGEEYYNQLIGLLKKKGTFVTAVGPAIHLGADEQVTFFTTAKVIFTVLSRKLFGSRSYQVVIGVPWGDLACVWAPYFADGRVKTVMQDDQIFDLKDAVLAHKKIESHRTVGKIILCP